MNEYTAIVKMLGEGPRVFKTSRRIQYNSIGVFGRVSIGFFGWVPLGVDLRVVLGLSGRGERAAITVMK